MTPAQDTAAFHSTDTQRSNSFAAVTAHKPDSLDWTVRVRWIRRALIAVPLWTATIVQHLYGWAMRLLIPRRAAWSRMSTRGMCAVLIVTLLDLDHVEK
jgi:hypothetical protein